MTVLCYDGFTLAADRMSRVRGKNGTRVVKSVSQEKILVDFEKVQFDDQRVLAVGRCGRLKVSQALIEMLRTSDDLYHNYRRLSKAVKKMVPEAKMGGASLLILTSDNVYVLRMNKQYSVTLRKDVKSHPLTLGSGGTIARFLIQRLGMGAVDAVAAMELSHDSCGGGVTYTNRALAAEGECGYSDTSNKDLPINVLQSVIRSASSTLEGLI